MWSFNHYKLPPTDVIVAREISYSKQLVQHLEETVNMAEIISRLSIGPE